MMTSPKTGSFLHRLQPLQKLLNPFSILFTLTLSLSLLVHGCSVSQNEQLKPLQIGITTWPGFDIVLYAQEAGLFEKRGLDIQFTRFDNQQDSSRAVLRGSLDAAFASLWDVMQVDPGNNTPVFIMTTNVSAGSDGLVSQKGIKSVKELVNKRVGAKLGTVNHLILLEALKLHQINPEDVIIEDIPNELAAEKMKNGDLDAAVLWQPLLGNIAQEIKGNVIFTTKDVDSLVVDGLVSSSTLLESHQKELTQFILAWFDVMHAIDTHPSEVFETVAKQLGQTGESFASDYAGLKKGDISLNQEMFIEGKLTQVAQDLAELLRKDPRHSRMIREDVDFNSTFINAAIEAWNLEKTSSKTSEN